MVSMQDKLDLIGWVEKLPKREQLTQYPAVLEHCATRYGNQKAQLAMALDYYLESFRTTMAKQLKAFQEREGFNVPQPPELNEMFESAMKATLLKMWTYGNEHYQRYHGPEFFAEGITLNDEELAKLLGGES